MTPDSSTIRAQILALVAQRGPHKTLCPSEVARALSPDHWRHLMPAVREVGTTLASEGRIVVTQKGQVVEPRTAKGPVRYGQPGPDPGQGGGGQI